MANTHETLTIRSVQDLLSQAGVDYSALTFDCVDRSGTHDGGMFAGRYVEDVGITVTGPKTSRDQVSAVLYDHELWCAAYPDWDEWSRDPFPL